MWDTGERRASVSNVFPVKGVRQASQRLSSRGLHAHDLPCITLEHLEGASAITHHLSRWQATRVHCAQPYSLKP